MQHVFVSSGPSAAPSTSSRIVKTLNVYLAMRHPASRFPYRRWPWCRTRNPTLYNVIIQDVPCVQVSVSMVGLVPQLRALAQAPRCQPLDADLSPDPHACRCQCRRWAWCRSCARWRRPRAASWRSRCMPPPTRSGTGWCPSTAGAPPLTLGLFRCTGDTSCNAFVGKTLSWTLPSLADMLQLLGGLYCGPPYLSTCVAVTCHQKL